MDHVLLMKVTSIMCIVEAVQRKKKALNRLQKKRSVWVKPWIERRQLHHGAYYDLLKELEAEDIKRDKYFPHMDKSSFDDILEKITPLIKREDTHMRKAISPEERLALTLRFLTSGNTYQDMECLYRVPRSTLSKLIPETCKAIYDVLKEDYLKVPETEDDWLKVAEGFKEKWQFPNCIGALDGQIIQINPRPGWVSMYKNNFSIIQMALVDADYKFIYVDVGCRVDDGGVWHGCSLKKALDDGTINIPGPQCLPGREKPMPHVIVADKVFPLKETIMKPYPSRGISKEKKSSTTVFQGQGGQRRMLLESRQIDSVYFSNHLEHTLIT
ncbi:uncharacterized protein [Antedon mediterranea]|uniref:uncharacterized protein n=1 Tax=Antedon mediterranea TaxID=105859 RepID=UPI003AF518C2